MKKIALLGFVCGFLYGPLVLWFLALVVIGGFLNWLGYVL